MDDNLVMLTRDGSNYSYWSHSMSQFMFNTRRELWDYVCGSVTEPDPGHENYIKLSKDWKTSNAKILGLISRTVLDASILKQFQSFKSGKEAWDYLAELYGQSTSAKKYQLETEIRAAQQGDRTIQEFHDVMVGLWDQLAKLENKNLSMLSSYKEYREEQSLVQFLIALRDEFEPLRKSILCRSSLPSIKQAVSELAAEEMRLKSSIVSSEDKGKGAVTEEDVPLPKFSTLALKTEDIFHPTGDLKAPVKQVNYQKSIDGSLKAYGYGGGFDQSHRYSQPYSSQARSAPSPSMPEPDLPDFVGGLAGIAMASFAAVKVSRALYNYFSEPDTVKILSYNVWPEDVELQKRMKALGDLIQLHSPDVVCFQEITPKIYHIFEQSNWWRAYRCSVSNEKANNRPYFCMQLSKLQVKVNFLDSIPLRNPSMGKEICRAKIKVCRGKSLVVATSHLKSPDLAKRRMLTKERVAQANQALNHLSVNDSPNMIFCGDMNWDEEFDGPFPPSDGWVDAWSKLRPWESGWTYDTVSNQMLSGNCPLQKRLDRFACNLHDFKLKEIDMIGKEAIPGLSYCKVTKVRNKIQTLELPVFPSDHYGLFLEVKSSKN